MLILEKATPEKTVVKNISSMAIGRKSQSIWRWRIVKRALKSIDSITLANEQIVSKIRSNVLILQSSKHIIDF